MQWPSLLTKKITDLEIGRVEGRQVGKGPIVLERDPAFVDVPLREVLGVDPLGGFVGARKFDLLHQSAHSGCVLNDKHDLAVHISI